MKIIYWLSRVLSIAFVILLSLFALDVFSEYSGWQAAWGFFIHLLPSIFLLAVVLISWKYDLIGAIVFLGFAVFYVLMVGLDRPWSWYATISGPALVVGILFLLTWIQKRKIKAL
jgi:uncharacterized membrane protein